MKDTDEKRAKKGNKRARGMDTAASKKDKDEKPAKPDRTEKKETEKNKKKTEEELVGMSNVTSVDHEC